jgi:prepilin-type N-terminal cleavage/methylation domain-containing protein
MKKGFTLIELTIVMIILGLLLGAVFKGRDIIRSVEIKRFYNNFIKRWEFIYLNFLDRTGRVLGAPLVVSEGSSDFYNLMDYTGADVTGGSDNDIVFRSPKRFKTMNPNAEDSENGWIANQLIMAGIDFPEPVRGYPNVYDVSASKLGKTVVIITFGSDPLASGENLNIGKYGTSNNGTSPVNDGTVASTSATSENHSGHDNQRGNFMLIINLPYDVAVQIDKIIDGKANGKDGKFICVGAYPNSVLLSDTENFNNVIDANFKGLGDTVDCGGPSNWGDGNTKKYVTALYKLGV